MVNALKVTEAGFVRVTAAQSGPTAVRLAVADTGPGLSAADRARVFEEWVQVGTPHSEIRGTGLGLPLVRRLAELLGGSVAVESTPGAGATFVVDLPAHPSGRERGRRRDRRRGVPGLSLLAILTTGLPGSSNGKTTASGAVNRGSNPWPGSEAFALSMLLLDGTATRRQHVSGVVRLPPRRAGSRLGT